MHPGDKPGSNFYFPQFFFFWLGFVFSFHLSFILFFPFAFCYLTTFSFFHLFMFIIIFSHFHCLPFRFLNAYYVSNRWLFNQIEMKIRTVETYYLDFLVITSQEKHSKWKTIARTFSSLVDFIEKIEKKNDRIIRIIPKPLVVFISQFSLLPQLVTAIN